MESFRYEVHAHTAEVSRCGSIGARDAVRMYHDAGYQGMVITDHFNESYFRKLGDIGWEEKIDRFLEGYRLAREEGDRLGMDILPGIEVRFREHHNEYLVYGLDEAFLKSHEDLYESGLRDFSGLIRDNEEILLFQAHPYRMGCRPAEPEYLDGMEVYNGNPRHNSRNSKAAKTAGKHGLLRISGSDFHEVEDLAKGGIVSPERINTAADLVRVLKFLQNDSLIVDGRPGA